MKQIIAEDQARAEIALWQEALETDLSETEIQAMLPTITRGRVVFNDEKESFTITFRKKIELENGHFLEGITLREPTAEELETASKLKDEMAMTLRLFSKLSGEPLGVIKRIGQKDLIALTSIFVFFA